VISVVDSPVRIFTNIPLTRFLLPEEQYRFCEKCNKFVASLNIHCGKCNACTSKVVEHAESDICLYYRIVEE
jgi:hypothetical protein